jgi:DNA modification methylase
MNVVNVRLGELKPYDKNPRKNAAAVDKVEASIKEFGFKVPIVIGKDGTIIAGHTRYLAARSLGLEEVPCIIADDLSDTQIKAFRLADNKTAEFSEWDTGLLLEELDDLAEAHFEMERFGFTSKPEAFEDDFNVDEELEKIDQPITKLKSVWKLGRHRLLCGDSTALADVELLMDGLQADMVFTDPPYNVDYTGGTGLKIKNDNMKDKAFYQFLLQAFTSMYSVCKEGAAIYVCHADSEGLNFRMAFKDSGWDLKQCIVWIKNAIVMGRQDHHWQHEPILYGWKPGKAHTWYGGRKQSTVIKSEDGVFINKIKGAFQLTYNNGVKKVVIEVPEYRVLEASSDEVTTTWRVDKPLKNGEHPTMKPIALCARAIENSSKSGDVALDLFGGSGSTLIACEQLERTCYMMELDEKYCDGIVTRWERLTGEKAERVY